LIASFITVVDNNKQLRPNNTILSIFLIFCSVQFCKNSENVLFYAVKWRH